VEQVKGHIVAYRRLVTPRASDTREELVPIHIADICRMTDDLVQSRKVSAATPDGDSRPAMRNIPERPSQRTSTSSESDVDISPSRALVFRGVPLHSLRFGAGKVSLRIYQVTDGLTPTGLVSPPMLCIHYRRRAPLPSPTI
jgi:hypothetical protein